MTLQAGRLPPSAPRPGAALASPPPFGTRPFCSDSWGRRTPWAVRAPAAPPAAEPLAAVEAAPEGTSRTAAPAPPARGGCGPRARAGAAVERLATSPRRRRHRRPPGHPPGRGSGPAERIDRSGSSRHGAPRLDSRPRRRWRYGGLGGASTRSHAGRADKRHRTRRAHRTWIRDGRDRYHVSLRPTAANRIADPQPSTAPSSVPARPASPGRFGGRSREAFFRQARPPAAGLSCGRPVASHGCSRPEAGAEAILPRSRGDAHGWPTAVHAAIRAA